MLNTPLQMFVLMLTGWVNEQHRAVNAYLTEENRVLRELHGKKRLRGEWRSRALHRFRTGCGCIR